MRRRTLTNKKLVDKEIRFTSSTNWTIPAGCTSIDIFLVGGGGGGGAYGGYWGSSSGGSASGGGTLTQLSIPVTSGSSVSINIGRGGSGGTRSNNNATNGYNTTLTVNSSTYTAQGGNRGLVGTGGTVNTGETFYTILGKAVGTGGYNNSGLCIDRRSSSMNKYIFNADGTVVYTVTDPSKIPDTLTGFGIPEFWESGKPTHAAGACLGGYTGACRNLTSYSQGSGGSYNWSYSGVSFTAYGGGGYGGGGVGGEYYSGTQSNGTNGGSGICIIRYKAYE